jgi:hypothetical protein
MHINCSAHISKSYCNRVLQQKNKTNVMLVKTNFNKDFLFSFIAIAPEMTTEHANSEMHS